MLGSRLHPLKRSTLCAACALATAWLVCGASPVRAADPSLGNIAPYGAQRGTEVDVTFSGARLNDAQEIILYEPGIEVKSLEVDEQNNVKTRLAISDDCRIGAHAMRVRTASGISNLRLFSVGALPEISEEEPNNDFDSPQAINLDVTVNGVVTNEDVDYFVVEAKEGERITAEIEGIRLGQTFFDPYVAIMDERRFELDGSDDSALLWQDGVASIVAPAEGRYIVMVRESSFGGSNDSRYRLHVGRFPRPTATVPSGGRPGETLEVRWLGDIKGEWTDQVTLPTEPHRNFGLFAQTEQGIAPSPNVFRLSNLGNVIESEPNNGRDEATPFTAPAALNGVIAEPGDVDHFKFSATKGQVLDIRVLGRALRSPLDSVLAVQHAGGKSVGSNDDSGSPDSYLRFTAPEDDDYVVSVRDHLSQGGPNYAYRVEVTPVEPKLTMGLPERQQFVDIVAPVPRGNRTAVMVSATRADFGGELVVDFNDLPPGIKVETVPMAANQTTIPVLLTAEKEAPLAGSLVDVVGRHADPQQKIEGHLLQTTSLVRGRNNVQVWTHDTERMAVAVAEEVPFSLEIVQPKVPLVRGGTMNLKVVATRQEGFTAPIAVRMLYDPSGVGSAGSISIAEGQTEAIIPLNAAANAELRTWKIAVLGEANPGNGNVVVSSQLADLQVAEPFFSFTFQNAAVEQGQETEVVIGVEQNTEFEGVATVELLGLPNEVTTEIGEITKDSEELIFKVKTTKASPAGKHTTLLCRAVVTQNGEPITHMIGNGELRIDVPLPPKTDQPTPPPKKEEKVAEKPPEKRLTRLEQLRLEREQAKQARAAAAAAKEGAGDDEAAEASQDDSGEAEAAGGD